MVLNLNLGKALRQTLFKFFALVFIIFERHSASRAADCCSDRIINHGYHLVDPVATAQASTSTLFLCVMRIAHLKPSVTFFFIRHYVRPMQTRVSRLAT